MIYDFIMSREIVLDTETTGLDFIVDRITEIGMVEIYEKIPTGNTFQAYVNPQIMLSEDAIRISGLNNEFLWKKPLFKEIAQDVIDFIGDSPIVAHNAQFDMHFLNKELNNIGIKSLDNKVIDTYLIAKQSLNRSMSLNQLCKKYGVGIEHRKVHGALIDAELLSKAYYYLSLNEVDLFSSINIIENTEFSMPYRIFPISLEENKLHESLVKRVGAVLF